MVIRFGTRWIEGFVQDCRYGLRTLFSAAAAWLMPVAAKLGLRDMLAYLLRAKALAWIWLLIGCLSLFGALKGYYLGADWLGNLEIGITYLAIATLYGILHHRTER